MALRPTWEINNFTFQNQSTNKVDTHKRGLTWKSDASLKSHLSTIVSKAFKHIDIFRALKFKLHRTALENIYLAFIQPIFEYASVVFDYVHTSPVSAARVVTGTHYYSSKQLLNHDTGWDQLTTINVK